MPYPGGRLQLKWFVPAALLVVAAAIPFVLVPQIALSPAVERAALSARKVVFCLAAFAAHLKDAVDLDSVCHDLARVVQTALEPSHVSVWSSPQHDAARQGSADLVYRVR